MSVRLTSQEGTVALFDSVSGFAFGPTFQTEEEAEGFLSLLTRWGERDARIPEETLKMYLRQFEEERKGKP